MKNKPYDLYELPLIRDCKDMIIQKSKRKPDDIAFTYSKGRNQIMKKTYREFHDEVNALGHGCISRIYRENILLLSVKIHMSG